MTYERIVTIYTEGMERIGKFEETGKMSSIFKAILNALIYILFPNVGRIKAQERKYQRLCGRLRDKYGDEGWEMYEEARVYGSPQARSLSKEKRTMYELINQLLRLEVGEEDHAVLEKYHKALDALGKDNYYGLDSEIADIAMSVVNLTLKSFAEILGKDPSADYVNHIRFGSSLSDEDEAWVKEVQEAISSEPEIGKHLALISAIRVYQLIKGDDASFPETIKKYLDDSSSYRYFRCVKPIFSGLQINTDEDEADKLANRVCRDILSNRTSIKSAANALRSS